MMERDPDDARAELEIALAGPLVSALLALLFSLVERGAPEHSALHFVSGFLAWFNVRVAVFNLLPGFPLDGGRVLRAFLWAHHGDPVRATRVAGGAGQAIAYAFILGGALQVLQPGLLGGARMDGFWLAFIGWFLLAASGATLRQLAVDGALAGLRARDVMGPVPARLAASTPVATFAREVAMRGRRWALVEDAGRMIGLVSLTDVRRVDPDAWETTPVGRIATPRERLVVAAPDAPVRDVLQAMGGRDLNQIPVVADDEILGAVTREGLVHAIELRQRRA
jgi:CBS domain-containing protein